MILYFPPFSIPDYGTIRKVLSPLNQSTGSCLLEEIELFPPRKRQPIRSLLILHSRSELYVGVRDQVIKIPLKRCSYHKTREWVHAQTNSINLNEKCQKQMCSQNTFSSPFFHKILLIREDQAFMLVRGLCWDLKSSKSAFSEPLEVPMSALSLSAWRPAVLSLTRAQHCPFSA